MPHLIDTYNCQDEYYYYLLEDIQIQYDKYCEEQQYIEEINKYPLFHWRETSGERK